MHTVASLMARRKLTGCIALIRMDVPKCEICDAATVRWATLSGYDLFRCVSCNHLFVYPVPATELIEQFYESGDFYSAAEFQHKRLIREARSRSRLLEYLRNRHGLKRSLLDIGCASGFFLQAMKEQGWSITGVEQSDVLAERARARTGATVWRTPIERLETGGRTFAAITAWEVIEHVRDPRVFMATVASHLSPGGLLALSTPLGDGLPAKLLGTQFPMLTPPEHLRIFSRVSVLKLAKEFSLEPVHVRSFSNLGIRTLASGFCKLLFGRAPLECNALQRAAGLLVGVGLVWIPPIFDAAGYGSEIQVIFRKR